MNFARDLNQAIDRWLEEDIREGDHTTFSTIPPRSKGSATLLAKQSGIIAGIEVAERVFKRFDNGIELVSIKQDGDSISDGDLVAKVRGKIHTILQCERLVLNIMQRMSGIATSTREYVEIINGTGARILDTRKTTPGFRLLEKEAVRIGGGVNHRFGLFDMILIKDNHIDFAGGIKQAIDGCRKYVKENNLELSIEVETRSLTDVEHVIATGGIQRIMFDNFNIEQTRTAVKMISGRFETESSGGITRESIRDYAECGVDFISVGALTHQVRSLDLSLKADFQ